MKSPIINKNTYLCVVFEHYVRRSCSYVTYILSIIGLYLIFRELLLDCTEKIALLTKGYLQKYLKLLRNSVHIIHRGITL